jgi:hypothetical protein
MPQMDEGSPMDDKRRGVALTIKSCLESLKEDATKSDLGDLARFIGLAAMAAEDAVLSQDSGSLGVQAFASPNVGHC